jgi:phage gp29-like protein
MKVLSENFGLYSDKGVLDEEQTKLIQKPWFNDLLTYVIDAEFWGHSLVELIVDTDNVNAEISLIPREHVSPERKEILIEALLDGLKLPYGDDPASLDLLEITGQDKLGLLLKAAPNVLFKFYARSDWSRASEKFGMPILHLSIDTNDPKQLDEAEQRASSFGTDGYIVTQAGDTAEIIERKGEKLHDIYLANINYCDEQISKLINGQTGTSDQKSFVGAAQVQERILDDYTTARLRNAKYAINFTVIPFLIAKGFTWLEGLEFDYLQFRKVPEDNKLDPQNPEGQKKK